MRERITFPIWDSNSIFRFRILIIASLIVDNLDADWDLILISLSKNLISDLEKYQVTFSTVVLTS